MSDANRLRDEQRLLEASLRDAKAELEAGELSQKSYEQIVARDTKKLEKVRNALTVVSEPTLKKSTRIRRARWLWVASICFAVAVGVLLYSALAPRQAGNSITGGLTLSTSQKVTNLLNQAEADTASGKLATALNAYQQVLAIAPKNVTALTQAGWLEFSAGSSSKNVSVLKDGVNNLQKAIILEPRNPGPRLYYAIVAASIPGNTTVAKNQFEEFLASKPSKGQMAIAEPFLKKLGLA